MAEFVEAIPHFLLRVFAPALGITLTAWLVVLFVPFVRNQRKQVRPVFSVSEGRGRRIPPVQWVVLFLLMAACTLFSGKNTNGVQNVGGGHLFQFNPPLVQTISPQDVSNGWRVAEETEAESFAQPSANAITNELWHRRGAFDDALRITANGWSYPYATGVTVLARGELRTSIRAHDFPRAFAKDISLLPLVSWSLLPEGRRESIFWYDTTSSNTLLTTWWNAALGRDATNPVNFQAELFPDGGFTYRYEDRTVRHARVWPFDWDNDGLENTVDPDPLTAGPDAHGTNAEWYNTVCSNLFSAVQGGGTGTTGILPVDDVSVLPWREGVNSNAYYFVDVVAEHGPAPIYFTGDRASRLGNPVVVANAFETNRVPLLIGVDYSITSDTPFTVSYPMEYMYPEVETNEPCRAHIRWPLNFIFTESLGASNRVYTVTVEPYDPGGVLEWDGNVPMRGGSGGDCDCAYCSGYSAIFSCSSTCTCSGGYRARGRYLFEVAEFALVGGECRCGFDDPPDDENWVSHEPNAGPSLTISFSKSAVIFEDAYEDRPGVTMPRRSTRVRLTIDAYGGPDGGSLWLTGANLGNLVPVDGGVSLPYSQALAAGESYHVTGVYEGEMESGAEGDVSVSGIFLSNVTSQQLSASDNLTVVKVELRPEKRAPENPCVNRHVYGVDESVNCLQQPSSPQVQWVSTADGVVSNSFPMCYICPIHAEQGGLSARVGTALLPLQINVIEPSEVVCTAYGFLPADILTGIGLALELKLKPFNVSFEGLRFQEVAAPPAATSPTWGIHEGYFNDISYQMRWYHYSNWGAGIWRTVLAGNQIGGYDQSRMFAWPQPWSAGRMTWVIPMAWKSKYSSSNSPDGQLLTHYISEWVMTGDYIVKTKHQQELTLSESGLIFLNGERYDP